MTRQKNEPRCNSCKAPIHFEKKLDGSDGWMVLQKVRSAYVKQSGSELRKANVPDGAQVYISHFEVCPHADEWSKGKRDAGGKSRRSDSGRSREDDR